MNSLSLEHVLELLDQKNASLVGSNMIMLRKKFGLESLVPYYVKAFYQIKYSPARIEIAYWLVRYAKKHSEIIDMALIGINDRSKLVRYHCCSILAFAGTEKCLGQLETLRLHKCLETQEDADAAIRAIINKNHHLWADRRNTGKVFWQVENVT